MAQPRTPEAPQEARVWSRYRESLARHLIGVSRDLQARVQHRLGDELGYDGLRPSVGPFLSLLWEEARPLAGIASELAISRQAASQLASLLEGSGYLERRANPLDLRSKLVVLTPRGRALVEDGVRILLETESHYAERVGQRAYRRFGTDLAALYRGLGLPQHADPALLTRAGRSVGVLPLIAVRIQRELMEATRARGHAGLKMSYAQVLPLIGPAGSQIHRIARIQRVSRQAISALARELEEQGYLRRRPDPRDRRGVLLELTPQGEALIGDSVAAMDELEAGFRGILGSERLAELQKVASDLYHALRLEAEVFDPEQASAPRQAASGHQGGEIEELASRLRRRLGRGDAARLAALLDSASQEGGA